MQQPCSKSLLAGFNLGTITCSNILNFTSVPVLTQGISLRGLKSAKNKPIGNTKHQVYAEFRLSVDGWVRLGHH